MKKYDSRPAKKPNIIFLFTDQHRAQSLGWNGDTNLSTPGLDNLARNGTVFSRAVAGTPWCTPFRGALHTGQYPHITGCDRTPSRLDPSIPTLADAFNAAGYHTAHVGKWHLSGSNSCDHLVPPLERGRFQYWMGYENNNKQNDVWIYGTDHEEPRRVEEYETRALSKIFLQHITQHVREGENKNEAYQPFFAVLSVQPPHSPYVPPHGRSTKSLANIKLRPNVPRVKRIEEKTRRDIAGYSAMVEEIDTMVSRIREELHSLDIDRETYIFYLSDHVDIGPTALGMCGIETPPEMVGFDYSHLVVHPSRQSAYHKNRVGFLPPESTLLQQIPRKYHPNSVNRPWRGVVTREGWKYVCTPGNDWLLFNLKEDPYEMNNLCYNTIFQKDKERLHYELVRLLKETGDEFEIPDIEME
jgi:arylsulfatase A-like enzyme